MSCHLATYRTSYAGKIYGNDTAQTPYEETESGRQRVQAERPTSFVNPLVAFLAAEHRIVP